MESDEKEAPTESKEKETVPQGPEFIKYLMEREQAKELGSDFWVVLVGDTVTEEALPTYEAWLMEHKDQAAAPFITILEARGYTETTPFLYALSAMQSIQQRDFEKARFKWQLFHQAAPPENKWTHRAQLRLAGTVPQLQ